MFHCRRPFRYLLLVILCLILLFLSSIPYYTFYCINRFQQGLIEANQRQLWNTINGVGDRFMPILMPVCDRPQYLKRVIDGLIKVEGINEVNRPILVQLFIAILSFSLTLDHVNNLSRL